eukprot:SAG11_NODE_1212_length_5506_cov_3.818384_4_plen_77_part_00
MTSLPACPCPETLRGRLLVRRCRLYYFEARGARPPLGQIGFADAVVICDEAVRFFGGGGDPLRFEGGVSEILEGLI